jgi:hypothetical protein
MSATFRLPEKWFPFQWLRLKSLNGKPTCDVTIGYGIPIDDRFQTP